MASTVNNSAKYTVVDVYPEDREAAKAAKRDGETWSDFLRRAGEEMDADPDPPEYTRSHDAEPRSINVYPDDRDLAKDAKDDGETWSDFLRRAAKELDPDT